MYKRQGYDSKKAADMRIYQQEKICEKHNLSKENPFGSKGLFAGYGKGPVGFYMAASSAVSVIFTGIAYVFAVSYTHLNSRQQEPSLHTL